MATQSKSQFPNGEYAAKNLSYTLGQSKRSGKPQIVLTFDVIGEYADGNLQADPTLEFVPMDYPVKRTIWWTLTPDRTEVREGKRIQVQGSWSWILPTLRHLGWLGTDISELDPEEPEGFKIDQERVFVVKCSNEIYEGVERDKWNVLRPGLTPPTAVEAPKQKAKWFKSLAKQFKAPAPEAGAEGEAVAAEPVSSGRKGDIPF